MRRSFFPKPAEPGVFRAKVKFCPYPEYGDWFIQSLTLTDRTGNRNVIGSGSAKFEDVILKVYSNTGGQASKATPRGAVAKFAAAGKPSRKKDLGMIAMSYGNVYVGQIALGANPMHTIRTILAAEAYPGTSLVIAYSHCIGQGINMTTAMNQQKEAVGCGYWPLYHYDPREEKQSFSLDSKKPTGTVRDFALQQGRFNMLQRSKPEQSDRLLALAQEDVDARWKLYEHLASDGV